MHDVNQKPPTSMFLIDKAIFYIVFVLIIDMNIAQVIVIDISKR